ncbi:MAG: cell division protein ZapA [Deltaproteobacteria bacterium]|nr:MAG: cell division protein ZapA [Deltaproteobacteria bacterium]
MKQSLQVTILGQQFFLRSDSPPDQVQRIAEFAEGQIQEITASGRVADSLQAAILALLNVSARYLHDGGQQELPADVSERLRLMVGKIERALDEKR